MSISIFLQSFTATFFILFAIGPICMTVINTTIIHGFRIGIFAVLGVSMADITYIIIASLTMYALESILQSKVITLIGICGGLFLYYLAYGFWKTKVSLDSKKMSGSRIKSFLTLYGMTLTGPTTIMSYTIVFSSFLGNGHFDALSAIFGGSLGTLSFYFMVVSIISIIRTKLNEKIITILNKVATIVITIMATLLIINAIKNLIS